MLRDIPLTRAAGMGPLPTMLEEAGGFGLVSRVFALAGLPTTLIDERNQWVPLSFLADLFRFGSEATANPLFGLEVGERMKPEQFGQWAIYGLHGSTVGQLIARLDRALAVHTQGVLFRLSPRANGLVAWEYIHPNVRTDRFVQHSDHIIPVRIKGLQRFVGPDFSPTAIEMPYRCSPSTAAAREDRTSAPWSFGKESVALILPEELLTARRSPDATPGASPNLEANMEALIEQSRREVQNVAMRIEVTTLLRLLDRKTDIEGLASLLGLSTRGLQRELALLGTSYRQMLTRVRMQRATELIENSEADLTEIALDLDYSDPAHFTRAFKRYFGYPPSRHAEAGAS